jgi:hypothetical protein
MGLKRCCDDIDPELSMTWNERVEGKKPSLDDYDGNVVDDKPEDYE